MKPLFFDFETCGLHGMPVLLQYAIGDNAIELYDLWKYPIKDTLKLFEFIANYKGGIVGFNLAFDWFHFNKFYNVMRSYPDHDKIPEDVIKDVARYEKGARDGYCVKPYKACDLFLHARKNKYQSLMERSDVRVRKVPIQLAQRVADELHARIPLNPLYFKRRKHQLENNWQIFDIEDKLTGQIDQNFKDIVLKFSPSSALKALAVDCLGIDVSKVLTFANIEPPASMMPEELGYAPFAEAIGQPGLWMFTWPDMISGHIDHWYHNKLARTYATDDVDYTRRLYYHEDFGSPELGDVDSELACAVAATRWKGFAVDVDKLSKLRDVMKERAKEAPHSPNAVKKLIHPLLTKEEIAVTKGSTSKVILEEIADWRDDCPDCDGESLDCKTCGGKGSVPTAAAKAAKLVTRARKALKEIEIFDKLITAGRLHASFKVIGALSGRMSGADGINPQGIKATYDVRDCFPLKFEGEYACGGDAESFEVGIAAAVYNDADLYRDLQSLSVCAECKGLGTKKGLQCKECRGSGQSKKKIHGIFATALFPDQTYEDVIASKGSDVHDMYTDGKRGVFGKLYGGDKNTLMNRLGISEEDAIAADKRWVDMYPGIGKAQKRIFDMFCSMRQPKAGGRVYWNDPAECMPTLLGFNRWFTLENAISKALFDLAENPPNDWLNIKITVRRRDRDQLVTGAVRSALFGAAFQIQAAAMRAATNHEIQGTGAGIIKEAQHEIWKLQPYGVNPWVVRTLNIHDELLNVTDNAETAVKVKDAANRIFDKYKPRIPLLSLDWKDKIETWADKI